MIETPWGAVAFGSALLFGSDAFATRAARTLFHALWAFGKGASLGSLDPAFFGGDAVLQEPARRTEFQRRFMRSCQHNHVTFRTGLANIYG